MILNVAKNSETCPLYVRSYVLGVDGVYTDRENDKLSDQAFIHKVYQDFKLLMYYTAGKYISKPDQREDIVQESLLKLIAKIETLRRFNRATIASYIVVTVRNTAINFIKRQSGEREKFLSIDELREDSVQTSIQPLEDTVIQREAIKQFYKIWPCLDQETRQVLEGKYFLGYDDKELAVLLGCQPNSVRMKLTRARRKAMELLKEGKEVDGT